jgi:hypothetical protein
METAFGHLTYCTNIHPGEGWQLHFEALKENVPAIKSELYPHKAFGIGLRLSHQASLELLQEQNLLEFKQWLRENECYVFTMNGFPYGGFHHTKVKDLVHQPDWTTQDRVVYTLRLFQLLAELLPDGMDGGISTSPLSYKYWHTADESDHTSTLTTATENILKIVPELVRIKEATGKVLHLDIEPEPDGLLESGPEFIDWYVSNLLPQGIELLGKEFGFSEEGATAAIREHVRLCYDICHFAVGYEDHKKILTLLQEKNIKVGKIQISAALKAPFAILPEERKEVIDAFKQFNESTYLHQVVALQQGNLLKRYRDLPQALDDAMDSHTREWRAHFHVPLFVSDYGVLKSTQPDIEEVLALHKKSKLTNHLEVETYTWEVLPGKLKLPLQESIIRELLWVEQTLAK